MKIKQAKIMFVRESFPISNFVGFHQAILPKKGSHFEKNI
jgi:hypothetical protein